MSQHLDNHQILFRQQYKWYHYHSSTGTTALPQFKKIAEIEKGLNGKIWLYEHPNTLIGSFDLKSKKITPISSFEREFGGKPITNYPDRELFRMKKPKSLTIWEFKNNTLGVAAK